MPCVETPRTYRDYAPSAWKGNSKKFVWGSGHLAYMIRFALALRFDLSSSRVHSLELPPPKRALPGFSLSPSAKVVAGRRRQDYALILVAPAAVKMYSPWYGSRALRKSDSYSVSGSTRKW